MYVYIYTPLQGSKDIPARTPETKRRVGILFGRQVLEQLHQDPARSYSAGILDMEAWPEGAWVIVRFLLYILGFRGLKGVIVNAIADPPRKLKIVFGSCEPLQ